MKARIGTYRTPERDLRFVGIGGGGRANHVTIVGVTTDDATQVSLSIEATDSRETIAALHTALGELLAATEPTS